MLPMFTTDMYRSLQVALEDDVLNRDRGLKLRLENLKSYWCVNSQGAEVTNG